ncbi:branched-chain amino acid aminotransferase [Croceiramulus getboli]|nr:branched-chain amino acid aminotransferase [Flavobacteriaceae bacterium YJPT1-3]
MKTETTLSIPITKRVQTKINEVDFSKLKFGEVFTDHMLISDYKNGSWQTPEIVPYGPITLEPSAKVFHYGQAIFEGMKAYKDEDGRVWLFRPDQNFIRINKSAERLAIPEIPEEFFMEGLQQLIHLERDWVKQGEGNSLYIRPFMIATQPGVSASPANEYRFMIILAPAQAYFAGDVRVAIAEKYSRSADGGIGYAKAAGNYAGQFYPTALAQQEGFQQVIWTDASTHEYIEEAGTMNVFVRIGDQLLTAPVSDRILDGVTRKSIVTLAKDMDIPLEVRPIKVQEVVEAARDGELKEMFGAGTAAVISPILGFSYKGERFELPSVADGYGPQFKKRLLDIQYNRTEDPYGWRVEVK